VVLNSILKHEIRNSKRPQNLQDSFWRMSNMTPLMIQLVLFGTVTPPYMDNTFSGTMLDGPYRYSYDDIIFIIGLTRLYLAAKLFGHYSRWTNKHSEKICERFSTEADVMFAIKSELKQRPYLMIVLGLAALTIILGSAVCVLERSFVNPDPAMRKDFEPVGNSMWLLIITMTTVGYGDFFPGTHAGRLICTIGCIGGMMLVSLMVISLNVSSDFTKEEYKAFFTIKKAKSLAKSKHRAATLIKAVFRFKLASESKVPNKFLVNLRCLREVHKSAYYFSEHLSKYNAIDVTPQEKLSELQERMESDINDIKNKISSVPNLEDRCNNLKLTNEVVESSLDKLIAIQQQIAEELAK
jgi:hypothetical protein